MNDEQEEKRRREEAAEPEVVFNESYEAEEVESNVVSQEEEDELSRIPLEQEPDMQEVMEEINRKRKEEEIEDSEKKPENMASKKNDYGLGAGAMILGILSLLLFCVPALGMVLAAMAIVLGIVAAARRNGKKMGTSGIIMGTISLLTYLLVFLIFGGGFRNWNEHQDYFTDTAWRRTTDGSVLYLYSDGTFIDVEREGDFTDNFYSGTYDVLDYEDAGLGFQTLENAYRRESMYDVILYVDTYVCRGEKQEAIAGTMRYLYVLDRRYEPGDVVNVYAHDGQQYGTAYGVKETQMAYPAIGNQYEEAAEEPVEEPAEAASDTESSPENEIPVGGGEAAENSGAGEDAQDSAAAEGESWGGFDDFMEDSRNQFEEFNASVSEEIERSSAEASSAMEEAADEASSAMEEAADEASSAMEEAANEAEDIADSGKFRDFFDNLIQRIQNWIARWSW